MAAKKIIVSAERTVAAAAPPPGRKSTPAARAAMIAMFRSVCGTDSILGETRRRKLRLQLKRRCERTVNHLCRNLRISGGSKLRIRDRVVSVSTDGRSLDTT